jgi:hypothetical protein
MNTHWVIAFLLGQSVLIAFLWWAVNGLMGQMVHVLRVQNEFRARIHEMEMWVVSQNARIPQDAETITFVDDDPTEHHS